MVLHCLTLAIEGIVGSAFEAVGGLGGPAAGDEGLMECGGARGALDCAEAEHVGVVVRGVLFYALASVVVWRVRSEVGRALDGRSKRDDELHVTSALASWVVTDERRLHPSNHDMGCAKGHAVPQRSFHKEDARSPKWSGQAYPRGEVHSWYEP